jgi:hypothetical protein
MQDFESIAKSMGLTGKGWSRTFPSSNSYRNPGRLDHLRDAANHVRRINAQTMDVVPKQGCPFHFSGHADHTAG